MQVWATARARAPMVGGVLVERMASSSMSLHLRTGLTPAAVGAGAPRAGTAPSMAAQTTRMTAAVHPLRRSVRHEDMAEDQLATEAAFAGGHRRWRAHGVVLVPERRRKVDVEAVAAGVNRLLEPAVADGGGGDGQEVVLGVLHHGTADLGDRPHPAGGPDLAGVLVDDVAVDPGGVQ